MANWKKKLTISAFIITTAIALGACGGVSQMVNTAEKTNSSPSNVKEDTNQDYKEKVEKWKKMYSKSDKTVEESVAEIKRESVGKKNTKPVVVKDSYTNVDEMAKFTSDMLFKFYKGQIKGDDFVVFTENYGSAMAKETYLTGKSHKEDVEIMNSIQKDIVDSGSEFKSYEISTAIVDKDIATFYRKLIATNGLEGYYQTTLIKVDGKWYFRSDNLNVPVSF